MSRKCEHGIIVGGSQICYVCECKRLEQYTDNLLRENIQLRAIMRMEIDEAKYLIGRLSRPIYHDTFEAFQIKARHYIFYFKIWWNTKGQKLLKRLVSRKK